MNEMPPVAGLIIMPICAVFCTFFAWVYYSWIRKSVDLCSKHKINMGRNQSGSILVFTVMSPALFLLVFYGMPAMIEWEYSGYGFFASAWIGGLVPMAWVYLAARKLLLPEIRKYYCGMAAATGIAALSQLIIAVSWFLDLEPSRLLINTIQILCLVVLYGNQLVFLMRNKWKFYPSHPR